MKRRERKEKVLYLRALPYSVQIAEVEAPPKAATETVAHPTGDSEHPQSHRQLGQS